MLAPGVLAAAFFLAAQLLALLFGIIGWRHICGKVAAIGAVLVVGLVGLWLSFMLFSASPRRNYEDMRPTEMPITTRRNELNEFPDAKPGPPAEPPGILEPEPIPKAKPKE